MLKFQQEEPPLAGAEEENASLQENHDLTSDSQQDFLTVSTRDQAVKRGTIILAILFAIGIGALVVMIRKSAPAPAAADDQSQKNTLAVAVAQITGLRKELAGDMHSAMLYELSNVEKKQVKVNELKKNPFMLDKTGIERASEAVPFTSDASQAARPLPAEPPQMQVPGMRLLGIMLSPNGNSCMINDRIVYKGDKIGGYEVLAINDDNVLLGSQGTTITLRIVTGK
jgi:preprotein translocase subunit SecG